MIFKLVANDTPEGHNVEIQLYTLFAFRQTLNELTEYQ